LRDTLKNGTVLCRLINAIKPNTIKRFNEGASLHQLKQLENVKLYLNGCWDLGIPGKTLFVPKDLQVPDRFGQVINNLLALNRYAVQKFGAPGEVIKAESRKSAPGADTHNEEEYDEFEFDNLDPSILNDERFKGLKDVTKELSLLRQKLKDSERKIYSLEQDKRYMEAALSTMKESNEDLLAAGLAITDSFIFGDGNTLSTEELQKLKAKGKLDTESVFYLEADLDPAAVKSLNALIRDIVAGKKTEFAFSSAANLKALLTFDSGRRLFVYLVKRHLKDKQELIIFDESFDSMLFLVNQVLGHIESLQGADFLTAQGILDIAPVFKHKKVDPQTKKSYNEELTEFIKDNHLWKDQSFWEDYFWQLIMNMPDFKKLDMEGFTHKQIKIISRELPRFVKRCMWGWGSTNLDTLLEFGTKVSGDSSLPLKYSQRVTEKIKVVYQFKAGLPSPPEEEDSE